MVRSWSSPSRSWTARMDRSHPFRPRASGKKGGKEISGVAETLDPDPQAMPIGVRECLQFLSFPSHPSIQPMERLAGERLASDGGGLLPGLARCEHPPLQPGPDPDDQSGEARGENHTHGMIRPHGQAPAEILLDRIGEGWVKDRTEEAEG